MSRPPSYHHIYGGRLIAGHDTVVTIWGRDS